MSAAGRAVMAGFVLAGCSAPDACLEDPMPRSIDSETVSRSIVLDATTLADEVELEVGVGGLPELWPAEGVLLWSYLGLPFSFRYEGETDTPNGLVEMPRMSFSLEARSAEAGAFDSVSTVVTPPFTSGRGLTRVSLFPDCLGRDGPCCPFGAQACEDGVRVRVERLDGAPFPPVVVEWSATASTTYSRCPFDESVPDLELREEAE